MAGADTAAPQWTRFLPELRREILRFLDETDLAEVSMVSRQCRDDCRDPSFSQRRWALIRCQPNSSSNFHYLHPLAQVLLKIPTSTNHHQKAFPIFQERFCYLRIKNPSGLPKIMARDSNPVIRALNMSHVTHLDMSSSEPGAMATTIFKLPHVAPSVAKVMTLIAPNVQVLDLSYNLVGTATLADASRNFKTLRTLRLEGGMLISSITGMDLKHCESLRELYLAGTMVLASGREEMDVFQNAEKEEVCPFHFCCVSKLERVSFRGCHYFDLSHHKKNEDADYVKTPFSQLGLIKFVRNATHLRWFDSDLTPENIGLLKYEHPDLVFVGQERNE